MTALRFFILIFLLVSQALQAEDDIDPVRLIDELEDNPVPPRKNLSIDWNLPVTTPGQVQKLPAWVISRLLGGEESVVEPRCPTLQKAMLHAEALGLHQTWAMLQIYLASYGLCGVDPVKAHHEVQTRARQHGWTELEALAGAELGLALAEGGVEQGFAILEEANQLTRNQTLSPVISTILRAYTAMILGLQNQHEKSMALQEELLKLPSLDQRRYQKAAVYFTLATDLLKRGGAADIERSKLLFKQSLSTARALDDEYTRALNEAALSSIAFREKRYDDAIAFGQSAFVTFDRLHNPRWTGIALFRVTQALVAKGHYAEAKVYVDQADRLFAKDDQRARMRLEEFYAQIHEGLGQATEALRHQKAFNTLNSTYLEQMAEEARVKQVTTLELDVSEAKNRELQKANELQAERLQNAQRLKQLLFALASGLVLISLLLIFSVIQTKKASDRKQKIRRILDHIDEGIVTIDSHLRIEAEYSQYLRIFLGEQRELTGLDALDVLLARTLLSAEEQSMIREALKVSLGEPSLAWELNADKLPREIIYEGEPPRYAATHWVPIFDRGENLQSVLLGIRDISAQRVLEAEVAETKARSMDLQQELAEILDAGVKPVMPLLQRAWNCLQAMHGSDDSNRHLPELHTIKGIARGLNLHILSHATHDLETRLKQDTAEHLAGARLSYENTLNGYGELLKMFHLERSAADEPLELLHEAVSLVLPGLKKQLQTAGLLLGSLRVDDQVGVWDKDILQIMPDILLHALTNSADHGYILNRVPRNPEFQLNARRTSEGEIEICLSDQGAGLNRDRVEQIARQKNFQPAADQEIWDVLLLEEATTATLVSQTSGRGIGLTAIQNRVKPLAGRLRLRPGKLGRGAELLVNFPRPQRMRGMYSTQS